MNKRTRTIEGFSWAGVAAILLAYILLNFDIIKTSDVLYPVLNILGGIAIVVDALNQKDYQPAVLNIIWAIVGLFTLVKIFYS